MRSPRTAFVLFCAAALLALAGLAPSLAAPPAQAVPRDFFGIAPQTTLSETDIEYMRAGRIGTIRVPVAWGSVQPSPQGSYEWAGLDQIVGLAAQQRLQVLPFLYATPRWLSRRPTTLPVDSARQRAAWAGFLEAAVGRYGPGGEFWTTRSAGADIGYQPVIRRPMPIRTWQIWNEANFFYFAFPASPTRYARLLKLSAGAIHGVDRGAEIVLSGLFGEPTATGRRGMPASEFLDRLYKVPGIKASFDGIALHPYAIDAEDLIEMTEGMRAVALANHDPSAGLYLTEVGWGSQNNFNQVAFEQGVQGQVSQLRNSYRYLISNRHRLNVKQVYWFSWKDVGGSCNFCDSVGLFRRGARLKPKPAWHALVGLSGGRARP
jgi:polysaccharide biosynthesis protein PslG